MRRVARFVRDSGLDITWQAEARLEKTLNKEFLQNLAAGGCKQLIFGMESRSQRVLELMRKNNSVENDQRVLDGCFQAGIAVNMQSFVGFPTETREEALQTIAFLLSNEHRIASIGFGVFTLFEGTPIYKEPALFGLRDVRRAAKDSAFGGCDYTPSAGMDPLEARAVYAEAMKQIAPIYGSRAYLVYGTHSLLQLSKRSWPELHRMWRELAAPDFDRAVDPEELRAHRNPALLLTPAHPDACASNHRALCRETGRHFNLSASERRILELAGEDRSVAEIALAWSSLEEPESDNEIVGFARGMAYIHEFLRQGLLRAHSSARVSDA